MRTLVLGATGATGKHLVKHLLDMGHEVRVIVRKASNVPESWKKDRKLSIIEAGISELDENEMIKHLEECQTIASCLGHNLNFKGIFGHPRRLVKDAVNLACNAIEKKQSAEKVKILLMNTTGNRNFDLNEPHSLGEKIVLGILRRILPPQADNEQAADLLRTRIGQSHKLIEWAAIRPDNLINEAASSPYEIYESPIRSAIFNPGETSRINVGHFMASLISDDQLWAKWKGKMPVIYNMADKK